MYLRDFEVDSRLNDSDYELFLSRHAGVCFCEPTPDVTASLEKLLTGLVERSKSIVYRPNDYSNDPDEARALTLSPEEICRNHFPSLSTPPEQIVVVLEDE